MPVVRDEVNSDTRFTLFLLRPDSDIPFPNPDPDIPFRGAGA
jgi:hypothetical protein